ncbi:ABC transporter ATP-binding protein [Paramaledivibacter caminithermalis]|jgi:oligopeptide/dipeptide ABC transporter ATP-binding protein|uniref:Oligopeptide transport system ATP-binding protein n=1 Tax=Paramaledivibacter caminithermalis (strain DSM 15212 / CIP 107654 / DViRD3) TaxID=1121301 RepID=A0A1M6PVC6_PARC5|nr:ABC transporter ATP-binding protein [Paramaledivibacter caminithermalis]SHK11891.1 oligopeptide transport system ATP-binding protein [Paramaledivibacter caminithermalis DSM 15212]
MEKKEEMLSVKDLRTYFYTHDGLVPAVDGISFNIKKGETLCVVGESGCGKSVTAMSILKLVPTPPGKYVSGEILFKGEDLLKKSHEEMRMIRGNDIAMIFQEPMTSLNPVFTVGNQICETVMLHQQLNKKEAMEVAVEMLRKVGIPLPEKRVREYPHQLSGGMRQRVMIAMALSCNPILLIADEPTTALDVTIQAQILDLMRKMKEETGSSIMFITHDLGVVAEMADRVVVMYAGKIVEQGSAEEIFNDPRHPYTNGLLKSIPRLQGKRKEDLHVIEGMVPSMYNLPKGCKFNPRCEHATDICKSKEPPLIAIDSNNEERKCACWLLEKRRLYK